MHAWVGAVLAQMQCELHTGMHDLNTHPQGLPIILAGAHGRMQSIDLWLRVFFFFFGVSKLH
jgi:hypothetical protein